MLDDRARVDSYVAALREVVRPGDVVVDIGTGTGVFAMVACQLGAARVYAIEPDPIIGLAKRIARENGFADRIFFMPDLSTNVELPERARVIVSDLRGAFPLYETHLPSIMDARARFLAPGGVMIPRSDALRIAVVSDDETFRKDIQFWERPFHGLDLTLAYTPATQLVRAQAIEAQQQLSSAATWATLDYMSVSSSNASGSAELTIAADGMAHGLAMWFDASLTPTVGFSCAPDQPRRIYRPMLLHWPTPVALRCGETVVATIRAVHVDSQYVWGWTTSIHGLDGVQRAHFSQTSMAGALHSKELLSHLAHDSVPRPGPGIDIDLAILGAVDGARSLEDIARLVAGAHPGSFPDWRSALQRVTQVCARPHGDHITSAIH